MAAADTHYRTPYGSFELQRYPARRAEPLQAWCNADSLLLDEIHSRSIPGDSILVVNDEQGALCVALQPLALWTDSALSALALSRNQHANGQTATPVVWSTQTPSCLPGCVALRIPKQLPYLEYQLSRLARLIPVGATVLAAGMDKHLSPRTAQILERYIGPTTRQPGQRKARLFCATRDERPAPAVNATSVYFCDALGSELRALPNVFSREKLDIGSRFLLQHLADLAPAETLVDLACGNGVLGLAAIKEGKANKVVFCDESSMAIASAWLNANQVFPDQVNDFTFHQGDGLLDYSGDKAQLILCNPPFHLGHTVDEFAGNHLLGQCQHHLGAGGRLCLVANRHLDYLPTLKRDFQRVEKIAQNNKFIIWLAHKA
jgi:23S rRNA (guanine1835-N2)-methyltransferase